MNTVTKKIVDAQAMTGNINVPLSVDQVYMGAVHSIWSGTPTGTLKLQASCDNVDEPSQVTNWEDISGASTAIAGASGSALWNVVNIGYKWLRLSYVFSSGTGTLNSTYNGKG